MKKEKPQLIPNLLMKTHLTAIAVCLLFTFNAAHGQTVAQPDTALKPGFRKLFTQGNLMMGENFIDSALKTFIVLYPMDTTDANVCYFIGQLYMLTVSHRYEALPYLEKAAKHVDDKYVPDDPYEKNAPPLAYYYLARAQHLNYKFDDAITNFLKFSKMLNEDDGRHRDIDYWITCCNNAKMFVESPTDCKVVNLGDSINSSYCNDFNTSIDDPGDWLK